MPAVRGSTFTELTQLFSFRDTPRRRRAPSSAFTSTRTTSGSSVKERVSSMAIRAFTAGFRAAFGSRRGLGSSSSARRLSTSSTAVTVSPVRVRVV